MFTPSDLAQLEARGISVEKAEKQLQSFATGFPELDIVSAASVGNGVLNPTEADIDMYVKAWQDYPGIVFHTEPGRSSVRPIWSWFVPPPFFLPRTELTMSWFTMRSLLSSIFP